MSAKLIWEQFVWLLISCALIGIYSVFAFKYFPPESYPGVNDTVGSIFGLSCVFLTRKENVWCWPHGIISVIFMAIFYWNIGLTGQAGLQGIYFLLIQFWGWYLWLYGGENKTEMKISVLSANQWFYVGIAIAFLTVTIYKLIDLIVPTSQFPLWDANIVACSIVAQTLLNWKKIESWWIWLIPVNISTIAILITTGAYMFAVMYIIYLFNASYAIYQWYKEYNNLNQGNNSDQKYPVTSSI